MRRQCKKNSARKHRAAHQGNDAGHAASSAPRTGHDTGSAADTAAHTARMTPATSRARRRAQRETRAALWRAPLAGILLCAAAAAHAGGLADTGFSAHYSVGLPNMIVGNIHISVSAENGEILYHNATTPQGVITGLLSPALTTWSRIRRDGARLRPVEYDYRIKNRPARTQHLLFDWERRVAAVEKEGETYELPLEDGLVDENTMQLQLIEDAANAAAHAKPFNRAYRLLSNGKLKTRRFTGAGTETIETALGRFHTIRIERIRRNKTDRILWLSPEHHYLPLKIERLKDGRVRQRMLVQAVRIGDAGTDGARQP